MTGAGPRPRKRAYRFAAALALAGLLEPGACQSFFDGDLEGWLAAVKFIIPDGLIKPISAEVSLPFHTSITAEATLHRLVCDGLRIGSLSGVASSASPLEGGPNLAEWGLQVGKVQLRCEGTVDYSTSLGLSGSADAAVSSEEAGASARIRVNATEVGELQLPTSVSVEDCSSSVRLRLEIRGGTAWTQIAQLIPGLVDKLAELLNHELDQLVCGQALQTAVGQLQGIVSEANEALLDSARQPGPPWPRRNGSFMDWHDEPLVEWVRQAQGSAARHAVLERLLRLLYPGGNLCLLGAQSEDVPGSCLLGHEALCVLGGSEDSECLIARSLHSSPPADLRLDLQDAAANIVGLQGALVAGDNATLQLSSAFNRTELHLNVRVGFNGWVGGAEARNLTGNLGVTISLGKLSMEAALLLGLDKEAFEKVPSYNYVHPQCVAPSFRDLSVVDLGTTFSLDGIEVELLENTPVPSSLITSLVPLLNGLLKALSEVTGPSVAAAALQGFLRWQVLGAATARLQSWASSLSPASCPVPKGEEMDQDVQRPLIDPPLAGRLLQAAAIAAAASAAAAASFAAAAAAARARARRSSAGPPAATPLLPPRALALQVVRRARRAASTSLAGAGPGRGRSQASHRGRRLGGWCRALCTAPSVPRALSVALPLAMCALTLLFLASNFLQLAETYVSLKAGSSETGWGPVPDGLVQVYQVMVYSLFYSIKQLRQEKLNALANLLMAFSGVLPYLKLVLMFVACVAPVRLLSYRWRGRILLAMDQFGKYSLVDVFVIQFISGALCSTLDLEVLLASGSAAPVGLGPTPAVLLRTSQSKGFAAFVLATVGSLIVGHICLYCHQRDPAVKAAEAAEAAAAAARGRGRAGRRPAECPGERCWRRYVGCLLALAVALVVSGSAVTAFTVQLVTPFGKLSEASHTLFGFAWALPHLAEEPNSFPTRFGQVTYVLFAVANIHLHLLLLCCAWFGRLPAAWLPRMATLARTLFAWSALDVAVLSMVITLLEMSTSNFVPLTSDMRRFLGKVLGRDIPQPGLEVKVWLGPGSFLLMAGALVHYFASKEVMRAMDQTVLEQEQAALSLREALSLGSLPSVPEGGIPSLSTRCICGVVGAEAEAEASLEEGHSSELVQEVVSKTADVARNV